MTLIDEVEWDLLLLVEYPQMSIWKEIVQSEAQQFIWHLDKVLVFQETHESILGALRKPESLVLSEFK